MIGSPMPLPIMTTNYDLGTSQLLGQIFDIIGSPLATIVREKFGGVLFAY